MSEDRKYCGIGKIPKGAVRGSMRDCAEGKQVRYYGVKTIDSRLLDVVKNSGKNSKEVEAMTFKRISLRVKIKKLASDFIYEKVPEKKKKINEERKGLIAELNIINDKFKRLEGGNAQPVKKTVKKPVSKPKRFKDDPKLKASINRTNKEWAKSNIRL